MSNAWFPAGLLAVLGGGFGFATAAPLPPDIASAVRDGFGADSRYLEAGVDLDGDGKPEVLVHVVGPGSCGSGGCTTLVFTPAASGYRKVASIGLTNPPIVAAETRSHGWRDLVVRIGGGGGESGARLLAFDGSGYPGNPSVAGTRVKAVHDVAGDVLIAPFDSFEQTTPLVGAAGGSAQEAKAADVVRPSFDCGKARTPAEKAVCADASLAKLDHELAEAYRAAGADWPAEERTKQQARQRAWLHERDACADRVDCITVAYKQRLVEVRIQGGQLEAPNAVEYRCTGHEGERVAAAFYNQTDPPSVVVTVGDWQRIAFAAPSGSGSRYVVGDVELWEHQGEATLARGADTWKCVVM